MFVIYKLLLVSFWVILPEIQVHANSTLFLSCWSLHWFYNYLPIVCLNSSLLLSLSLFSFFLLPSSDFITEWICNKHHFICFQQHYPFVQTYQKHGEWIKRRVPKRNVLLNCTSLFPHNFSLNSLYIRNFGYVSHVYFW